MVDDVIAKILAKRTDLTCEKIQGLIEEKKREAHDLLSEEGAARLVAEELLVETEPAAAPSMEIRNLVAGLNNISLTARVVATETAKSFVRQDGTTGQVARLVLGDETGKIECAVWDERADDLLRQDDLTGRLVTIKHAYTRAGLTGEVELNLGERSEITVAPQDEIPKSRPVTPIGEVKEPAIELNLLGVAHSKPRIYQFERNGQTGTVLRTILSDKTGFIPLVAWNERAEELRDLQKGDVLSVQDSRLRRDSSGRLEIHLEGRAKATILKERPEGLEVPDTRPHKIVELRLNLPTANFVGRIVSVTAPQQVQRKTGENVTVARILVADETGTVSVSLWDDKARLASEIRVDDLVRIEDATAIIRLGQLSINAGRTASVERLRAEDAAIEVKINKIGEIGSTQELASIEGDLVEEPETREVTTGKGEKVQVASVRMRDDTGEARISFWRSLAAEVDRLPAGSRIRVYGLFPRLGLSGETELSTSQGSRIDILSRAASERPSAKEIRQFIAMKENEEIWVRATVLDVGDEATLTAVCAECEQAILPSNEHFTCSTHGDQAQPSWLLTMSMRLDDGTDTVMAEIRTRQPQSLVGRTIAWAQKEILAIGTSRVALPIDATGKLTGMAIEALGVTKRDPKTGKLVLHTAKVLLQE
jgi:replication factor A1